MVEHLHSQTHECDTTWLKVCTYHCRYLDDLALVPGTVVIYYTKCSGNVVVSAYEFESGRPGSYSIIAA